jgi:hypothetical protein
MIRGKVLKYLDGRLRYQIKQLVYIARSQARAFAL